MKKFLIASLFGWIMLISWFSNQPLKESTKQTYDFLVKMNIAQERELILSSTEEIRDLKHLARKAAHFGLYFCLGGLMGLCYYGCLQVRGAQWFWLTWSSGSLWGVIDEIHQYFIPGRAMLASDMFIDSMGVLLAVGVLSITLRTYQNVKLWRSESHRFMENLY